MQILERQEYIYDFKKNISKEDYYKDLLKSIIDISSDIYKYKEINHEKVKWFISFRVFEIIWLWLYKNSSKKNSEKLKDEQKNGDISKLYKKWKSDINTLLNNINWAYNKDQKSINSIIQDKLFKTSIHKNFYDKIVESMIEYDEEFIDFKKFFLENEYNSEIKSISWFIDEKKENTLLKASEKIFIMSNLDLLETFDSIIVNSYIKFWSWNFKFSLINQTIFSEIICFIAEKSWYKNLEKKLFYTENEILDLVNYLIKNKINLNTFKIKINFNDFKLKDWLLKDFFEDWLTKKYNSIFDLFSKDIQKINFELNKKSTNPILQTKISNILKFSSDNNPNNLVYNIKNIFSENSLIISKNKLDNFIEENDELIISEHSFNNHFSTSVKLNKKVKKEDKDFLYKELDNWNLEILNYLLDYYNVVDLIKIISNYSKNTDTKKLNFILDKIYQRLNWEKIWERDYKEDWNKSKVQNNRFLLILAYLWYWIKKNKAYKHYSRKSITSKIYQYINKKIKSEKELTKNYEIFLTKKEEMRNLFIKEKNINIVKNNEQVQISINALYILKKLKINIININYDTKKYNEKYNLKQYLLQNIEKIILSLTNESSIKKILWNLNKIWKDNNTYYQKIFEYYVIFKNFPKTIISTILWLNEEEIKIFEDNYKKEIKEIEKDFFKKIIWDIENKEGIETIKWENQKLLNEFLTLR